MPEHPRAIQARQLFHALWDDGDMEATIEAMSADVVWVNDIGAGPLRELRGRDQVRALLLWWFDFFDGNCRHELIDVCASDDRVIEVLHEIGEKDGRVFDNVALYVFEVDPQDPDRFARVRTYDRDRANVEEFWSQYPDVLTADVAGLLAPFLSKEEITSEELRGLHDRARLVTLVGPGGCGKTRLALELVRTVAARKAWIELATVDDDGGVATAFLAALGERDDPQSDPVDQIVDSIGNLTTVDPIDDVPFAAATFVLLVDNAEHVVEPVARVSGLRVVVTSREPLGIAGEAVYRVPPMGHAALGESSDRPGGRDAVDLFVDRASLVRPELKLDASALGTVSEICRRLDGLPLGVELAAARLDLLSPERIRDGLQDRFRLLVSGNRAALPRHRTLEASVAWSYSLLAADERHLLDRLAVFRGSFDTAAVDAVASGAVDADRVDDLLGRLVSKSLLAAEPRAEGTRFRLLDTIAAYAARQLAERGEVGVALDQLADHVARCTAAWDQDLMGDEQVRLLEALAIDDGIVSVALDHLTANARDGNVDAADLLWSIVGRLTFFWLSAGRFREARSWFATAEAVSASDARLELPARWGASHLATYAGDFEAAIGGATATCQLAKELGDNRFAGRSLDTLGSIESYLDPVAAIATLEQAIELAERAHDRWGLTDARPLGRARRHRPGPPARRAGRHHHAGQHLPERRSAGAVVAGVGRDRSGHRRHRSWAFS